jgi:penicillin-binding protein 1A
VIPLLTFFYFAATMGDVEQLMNRNNTGVVLKDANGEIFYSTGTAQHRALVPVDNIAKSTQQALIASEDKNFYEHGGISILSTLRAVYGYIFSGGGSFGGSTLTQQLAKMTLLSSERSFLRQYQAFSVALAIEQRYDKDEILAMYLNTAYFGNSSFGIEQAARNYFNKTPADLTLAESALLIGLLPAPSIYSPVVGDPEKGAAREEEVLRRMVREGMISEDEKTAALAEKLNFQPPAVIANDAPHFTEMVIAELYEKYGEEQVERSGYQVTTTLNLNTQRILEANITNHIGFIQANGGTNAAGVAIDPKTGGILALVGSADWGNEEWGKFNVVTSPRQPGSSFKPIYYSAALANGAITPATILHDVPTDFGGYAPQNADRRFRGDISVRSALNQSLNIPSVEVLQKIGVETGIEAAKKLGITTIDENHSYGLSLALGSAEVPLIEMTNAYAAFANEGQQSKVVTIKEINDKFNVSIFRTPKAVTTPAITPQGAFLISSILSDNNARSVMFGSSLNVPGRTAAVKTGTTDEQRDAWTIGYTPQIALGIWVGNSDNSPMSNGGSSMAGPIWVNTMSQALKGVPDTAFAVPAGIVQRAVCYGQEALATRGGYGTFDEFFLSSALPPNTCTPIEEPKPKEDNKDDTSTETDEEPDSEETTDPDSGENTPPSNEPNAMRQLLQAL